MVLLFVLLILCTLMQCVAVVIVAELSVHPPVVRRLCDTDGMALQVAKTTHAMPEQVQIQSVDGKSLSAWWMPLHDQPREAVLLCHGVADTAFGVMGAALMFLRNGYSVLIPDNRGHGRSKGFVTYGVREASDVKSWQQWLTAQGVTRCFGFGESLGASALLQSLQHGARFSAIIAECPFSSFQKVAWDRMEKAAAYLFPKFIARPLAYLWTDAILFYLRLRYRIDLSQAQPVEAVRHTKTPILLIHGGGDRETPSRHSEEISAANKAIIRTWLVSNAEHTGAYAAEPYLFEARVLQFLKDSH